MTSRPGFRAIAIICIVGLLIGVLFIVATNNAAATDPNDFTYDLIDSGTHAEVTGYMGTDTDISIPATLGGLDVTAIGANSFQYSPLTSISFPDTVTTIGGSAFDQCLSLSTVSFGPSSHLDTIGYMAFSSCTSLAVHDHP